MQERSDKESFVHEELPAMSAFEARKQTPCSTKSPIFTPYFQHMKVEVEILASSTKGISKRHKTPSSTTQVTVLSDSSPGKLSLELLWPVEYFAELFI